MRMSPAFLAALITLPLFAQAVDAADLKAISFAGSYRIRVVGVIEPEDPERLVAMFSRRGGLPDSVYLESTGGDIDASIAIGRIVRQYMIRVDSLRLCNSACFLAWVGGVNRIAQGGMDVRLQTRNSSETRKVRAYLEEMEVPENVIQIVLDPAAELVSRSDMVAATGSSAPSHHAWLQEQCGALNEEEVKDWQSIQALKALENALASMGAGIGDNQNYNVGSETQRLAARAIGFTQDHRDEIDRKYTRITSCEKRVIADARRQL
jgi:hypothetical protein